LRRSEDSLRAILNNTSDAIVVHALDGRVFDANRRFLEMYRIADPAAARSLTIPDLSSSANPLDLLSETWSRVIAGENLCLQWRARRPGDGSEFDVEVRLTRIRLENGDAVLANIRDVTEQRRTEQALRRHNHRLAVLNTAAEALLSTAHPEAVLPSIYDRMASFFQVDGFIEFRLNPAGDGLDLVSSRTVGCARTSDQRALRLGEGIAGKVALTRRPIVLANAQASTDPNLRYVREIGAQAFACEPLVVGDRLLGTLAFASSRRQAFEPEDQEFFRTLANYIALARERERLIRELQNHATQLETTVRERTAQLVEANANLQTFAFTAAHDLRSPLRSINSFSTFTLEQFGPQLGPEGQSYLERVVRSAEQMSHLLNDLLEYSRLNQAELRLERVPLEKAIEDALALLQEEIHARGAQCVVDRPLPAVLGHPATVILIVTNFVANALKFVPPDRPPRIRLHAGPVDEFIRLVVEDNGIGIEAGDLEKLFQVFSRLHARSVFPGTGLGLAIVRRAVERMGGRVGVESEIGKGSCFWAEFRVPDALVDAAGTEGGSEEVR
jgi:PAS domain S-box-containing protein